MSVPGPAGLSDDDMMLVVLIRRRCALAFDSPIDYPFFSAHYVPNEHADAAILRVFREEMSAHRPRLSTEAVIDVMIYG